MNTNTTVSTGWLSGLKLATKLQILGLITLVLTLVPFYKFFMTIQDEVNLATQKHSGFEPARQLLQVVTLTQQYRGISAGAQAGNEKMATELPTKKAELDRAMTAMEQHVSSIGNDHIHALWSKAQQEWNTLSSNANKGATTAEYTRLIAEYLAQLDLMLDYYKLSLDDNLLSYNLIQTSYATIPQLNEALGQLRALGTDLLTRASTQHTAGGSGDTMTLAERIRVATIMNEVRNNLSATLLNLGKAVASQPQLDASLKGPITTVSDSTQKLLKLIRSELAEAQELNHDHLNYFSQVTDTIGTNLQLSDAVTKNLGQVLSAKLAELRTAQIVITLILLALIAFGILATVVVMRAITGPVSHLQDVMKRLHEGDATARAQEIGELGNLFNSMVDERESVAERIRQENEHLNDSVLSLLQGMARLAQKDLTAKVPVAEDVTGAVADALNLLASETAKVLKQVTDISADVTGTSLKVKQQSDTVLATAEAERQQVERTADELRTTASAVEYIQQLAQSANQAADNAIQTTQAALATVNATVGGINSTRDTIRETEKRIKRLGERSQEISGVVGLINTIAERTHILALNASMHAASAGEAGRGFAVVAEEVQRLAENARQATAQITTLVNNIQVETVDTVNTMNAAISQVVDGSRLAEQAGEQMKRTQETTAKLVDSVRQIATSSQKQAQMSSTLLGRADDIRKSTEHTSSQLNEQAVQIGNLVEYARSLLGAVRVFKLPT